jgi:hypothetical protein
MEVPVDDHDPLESVGSLGITGCHSHVVEEAKAHGPAALCVMARGADQREGIVEAVGYDTVYGLQTPTSGMDGGLVGARGRLSVGIQRYPRTSCSGSDHLDVLRIVDALEVFLLSRARRDRLESSSHFGLLQHLVEHLESTGAFGMEFMGSVLHKERVLYNTGPYTQGRPPFPEGPNGISIRLFLYHTGGQKAKGAHIGEGWRSWVCSDTMRSNTEQMRWKMEGDPWKRSRSGVGRG